MGTQGTPPWVFILIGIGAAFILLIIVWIVCKLRQNSRYDFSALDEERSLIQKWDEEKRVKQSAERDAVMLNCYYYLRDSSKYSIINHLPDIGSRINKHWFLVQDTTIRSKNLLTMSVWSQHCVLPCNKTTRKTLSDLFSVLKHPYISPILSVDLMLEHQLVVMIQPYNQAGSLKDLIYSSHPNSIWMEKYEIKGKQLADSKIKNYGRQILEALIYLQMKGLPQCVHLHTGNVFIVNGVCKISGYGNTLLGYKARLEPLIKRIVKTNEEAVEVISFGHLLYEMASGCELKTSEPDPEQLSHCRSQYVVEVLRFIFHNESGSYPYLEEIAYHSFFREADVSHLSSAEHDKTKFSSAIKTLLKLCRKEGEGVQRRRKSSTKKRYRGESVSDNKRERTRSKSKCKKTSIDAASVPAVAFKAASPALFLPTPVAAVPPPPPLPPAELPTKGPGPAGTSTRASLLAQIRTGTGLRKTKVNDRSKRL